MKKSSDEIIQEKMNIQIEAANNFCSHEFENKYMITFSKTNGTSNKDYHNVKCIKCECSMEKADEDLRRCYVITKELNKNHNHRTNEINYCETHLPHYHIWDNCGNCVNKLMFESRTDGSNKGFEIIGNSLHFNSNSKCLAKRNKIKK